MAVPKISNCCGCCSLRSGTIFISILSMVASALLIGSLYSIDLSGDELSDVRTLRIVITVFGAIIMFIAALLLFGTIKRNTMLMLPWIIIYAVSIVVNAISSIYMFISALVGGAVGAGFGSLIGSVIGILISIYLWLVVHAHYKELKDEARNGETGNFNRPATSYQQP